MVARSYFSHDGRNGSSFLGRIRATGYLSGAGEWLAGENLAWGTGSSATPRQIMRSWMASPGHRANILEHGYREIGIGISTGNPMRRNGAGATYGTEFGTVGKRSRASRRTT